MQKTVSFVQQPPHRFFGFAFLAHGGNVLPGFAHTLAHQVTGVLDDEWARQGAGRASAHSRLVRVVLQRCAAGPPTREWFLAQTKNQSALACSVPGEHRHQRAGVAVFAHQHGRQFVADFHQAGQVSHVVLEPQTFDRADMIQPRAGAQGFSRLGGGHPCNVDNSDVGFWRVADLERHQR